MPTSFAAVSGRDEINGASAAVKFKRFFGFFDSSTRFSGEPEFAIFHDYIIKS